MTCHAALLFSEGVDVFKSRRQMLKEIEDLSFVLHKLNGELAAKLDSLSLVGDYDAVKKALTDKEIELSKLEEDHARQIREVEHKVGLHKIQTEHDVKAARKEAELAVREEGLNAQKDQFKDQMDFMAKRMENEIESQRDLMEKILSRLPSFERSHQTVEHIGVQPAVQITDGKS